jgi:hypothetical protein
MRLKLTLSILFVVIFVGLIPGPLLARERDVKAAEFREEIYIPLVRKPRTKLIGMYFQGASLISQDSYDTIINPANDWSGGKLSIIGTFMNTYIDGNYYFHVAGTLDQIWENNYVPFVNLQISASSYEIASGKKDQEIHNWALAYKTYAEGPNGEERIAFIAPLQEMNSCQQAGCWTQWGGDPGNYKIAYRRIRQIFDQVGIPINSVRWVFAPNGWSHYKYDYPFENYYPGHEFVDVVAISAYNFGGCTTSTWKSPEVVFNNPNHIHLSEGSYLDRLREMAPAKKIFIAQTGTAGYGTAKNLWLDEAYDYLGNYPGVSGVLYFNIRTQCEWRVYAPPGVEYPGYVQGVYNSIYTRETPQEIRDDPVFSTR